jgi:hypothetical protein
VTVDLQAVFTRTYEAGPYHREIDYRQDWPVPPLTSVQADWIRGVLGRPRVDER